MQLVERTIIKQNHPSYQELDNLAFLSKNLYNIANYLIRQEYIINGNYLNYYQVQKLLQNQVDYQALPAKVSQQVLRVLDKNWASYFAAIYSYNQDPSKFKARPKLPKYKHKTKGRNLLIYTRQAISKPEVIKNKTVFLSKSNVKIKTGINYESLAQVRIIPKLNYYVMEVVYERDQVDLGLDKNQIAGIDLGVNNLATVTSNKIGFQPIIVNGRPVKSINQYYDKQKAKLQSQLKDKKTSKRIQRLATKRSFKVDDYLHKTSRFIIDYLIENQIGKLIIGNNEGWKQNINLGKRNNQIFVKIPYFRLINMLKYKAELVGIEVIVTEESYTSKASFFDQDEIPKYQKGIKHSFSGKRPFRGLYQSSSGKKLNADCNGSLNIIRKVVPDAFSKGIEGVVVHPIKVTLN